MTARLRVATVGGVPAGRERPQSGRLRGPDDANAARPDPDGVVSSYVISRSGRYRRFRDDGSRRARSGRGRSSRRVQNLLGGDEAMAPSRAVTRPTRECTGHAFPCEDVLAADGVPGFDRYAVVLGASPQVDLFVDHRLTSRATARSEPSAMATSARCRAIRCSLASMTASREHPPRRLR